MIICEIAIFNISPETNMANKRIFRDTFGTTKIRNSFKFALKGFIYLFSHHRNMRIIFLLGLAAFLLGVYYKLRGIELMILCLTICLVFVAEIVNTTMELILNTFVDKYHPKVKIIKDISAAVVLLASLNALAIGYILFIRRLLQR